MLATLMLLSALSIGANDGWGPFLPETADDYRMLGNDAMQSGDPVFGLLSFRRGLAEWPEDPRLQRQLSRAESALQKGPMPIAFAPTWLTRRNLSMLGAACLVLAAASYSIGRRTRHRRTGLVGVLAVGLMFLSAFVAYERRDAAGFVEFYLVRTTTPLRLGNGPDYDEVPVVSPLCAGQEVHVLGARGSWSRVACPSGTTGWLPSAILVR